MDSSLYFQSSSYFFSNHYKVYYQNDKNIYQKGSPCRQARLLAYVSDSHKDDNKNKKDVVMYK